MLVAAGNCAAVNNTVIAKSPAPRKAPDLVVKYSEKIESFCSILYRRRNSTKVNKKLPNSNASAEGSDTAEVAHKVV
jgi:hypothetical protein